MDVTVAFRPEDVTLLAAEGPTAPWTGRIHSAVVGSQIEYVVDLGSSKVHAFGLQHDKLQVRALVRVGVREEAIRNLDLSRARGSDRRVTVFRLPELDKLPAHPYQKGPSAWL